MMKANGGALPEEDVWSVILPVARGLKHLHSLRILHRDLKPANIFRTGAGETASVVIGDLGLGRVLGARSAFAKTGVGTPLYFSPELAQEKPYNDKSDVWAFGCLAHELLVGKPPFEAKNQLALASKIVHAPAPSLPDAVSPDLAFVIHKALTKDPERRPSMADLLGLSCVRDRARAANARAARDAETAEGRAMRARLSRGTARFRIRARRVRARKRRRWRAKPRLCPWRSRWRMSRAWREDQAAGERQRCARREARGRPRRGWRMPSARARVGGPRLGGGRMPAAAARRRRPTSPPRRPRPESTRAGPPTRSRGSSARASGRTGPDQAPPASATRWFRRPVSPPPGSSRLAPPRTTRRWTSRTISTDERDAAAIVGAAGRDLSSRGG